MPKRLQVYEAEGITVTCLNGLPKVFDVRRRQWVDPTAASPEDVRAQVERCPSGALQVRPGTGGAPIS
jgi:uncharacterized Fe-S cluster protein YjdI